MATGASGLITHAHADHARAGSGEYWAIDLSEGVLRQRLGRRFSSIRSATGKSSG